MFESSLKSYSAAFRLNSRSRLGPFLEANVLTVRNLGALQRAMKWRNEPSFDKDELREYRYLEDLNNRRIRDAEVIASACCNGNPRKILEIGTGQGQTTALMARNAPQAMIYTVNIPPEKITQGGRFVTGAPPHRDIGKIYRQCGLTNVRQILANTARWSPDFSPIDVAFIDGCHDRKFVYNDTRKVLACCNPGSVILWHDFAPSLARAFEWIADVCAGVERLYRDGLLHGKILHLQDSWVGLYQVPEPPC